MKELSEYFGSEEYSDRTAKVLWDDKKNVLRRYANGWTF